MKFILLIKIAGFAIQPIPTGDCQELLKRIQSRVVVERHMCLTSVEWTQLRTSSVGAP